MLLVHSADREGIDEIHFLGLFAEVTGGHVPISRVTAAVWLGIAPGNSHGDVPPGSWTLPLGLAVFALVLRRIAERRWLTIDWLRYRAPRPSVVGSPR